MNIPYRLKQGTRRALVIVLIIALVLVLVWACWLLWVQRFIVYTRDEGAVLDFTLPPQSMDGELAVPPEEVTVPIYYNEGDNAVSTNQELVQLNGYYVSGADLQKDVAEVRKQLQTLPMGTPVMVDVKNIHGSFYYSSAVSDSHSNTVDIPAVDSLMEYLKSSNLYTIARLPALRDYAYGLNHVPDGLPTSGGYLWMDGDGCYWLNPNSEGTISYLVQIITELKSMGFDEVVFYDFYFPETQSIVFSGDKIQALTDAAAMLVSTCATESFGVSFVGNGSWTLPQGRSRLYMENVEPAQLSAAVGASGVTDTQIRLVFITELHDTRFEEYGVLRPLSSAH